MRDPGLQQFRLIPLIPSKLTLVTTLARYARIWLAQIRYSTVRELMFKSNFLLWIVVDLAWFGLSLAFIQFLYLQVDTIATWTKWEMILLVATNNLVQQIFQTFLMINCTNLPELVRSGKLDFFLAQPASPQFLVSTRKFEPGSVVSCAFAMVVCIVAIVHLPTPLSWLGLALYPALVMLGVLIHYALMLMLMSLSFWMTRARGSSMPTTASSRWRACRARHSSAGRDWFSPGACRCCSSPTCPRGRFLLAWTGAIWQGSAR
jgi:ABC-type uncharacterized transport system permease subunit